MARYEIIRLNEFGLGWWYVCRNGETISGGWVGLQYAIKEKQRLLQQDREQKKEAQ